MKSPPSGRLRRRLDVAARPKRIREPRVSRPHRHRFFLGGADLEMVAIRTLLEDEGLGNYIEDKDLTWGAKASAYNAEIRRALDANETPVLIELTNDLPADIPDAALVWIDHHGTEAGAEKPSSLQQVVDMLDLDRDRAWTRERRLIVANDIGHIRLLRSFGATAEEIRSIRARDRAAQGVTATDEEEARLAVAAAERRGRLTVVRTRSDRTSAIGDFIEPEFDGPGAENLLVVGPGEVNFFGDGRVVERLRVRPGSWSGGALPERGFWGMKINSEPVREALVDDIGRWVNAGG